jgi:hypothetical protein
LRSEIVGLLDFTKPTRLIRNAVMHHILDEEDPRALLAVL